MTAREIEIGPIGESTWSIFNCPNACPLPHVVPNGDLFDHVIDDAFGCACVPYDEGGCIVHNSFDGREAYEEGGRKPN